jgi:hypothetical protein
VPILEAYLVIDEESVSDYDTTLPPTAAVTPIGGHDTVVYEATPLELDLPWWKQMRTKVFMVIICVLITALLAVGLGVTFSRPTTADADNTTATTITTPTAAPIGINGASSSSVSLSPTQSPTAKNSRRRLWRSCYSMPSGVSDTYGWPIGSWCVGDVTDMSNLFEGLDTFDEDISGWNMSSVANMREMF